MLTFRYKDMRVRYQYMLALACAALLQMIFSILPDIVKTGFEFDFSCIINLPMLIVPLVLIFISLRALSYKVKFSNHTVTLNNTKIELTQIERIKFNEQEPSYTVQYGESKSRKITMGLRDSDEDTGTFRHAMSVLISRARQSNPKIKINQDTTDSLTPGTKVYEKVTARIRDEKAKLTGIGGWLIYLAISLAVTPLSHLQLIVEYIEKLIKTSVFDGRFWGNLSGLLLEASLILFSILLLVSLLQRKSAFKKEFLLFLIYSLVAGTIGVALRYSLLIQKWPDLLTVLDVFVMSSIYSILWLFAWRAYFQRSIRVKNTFPDEIHATKTN